MAAPIYTPLPTAPARTMTPTAFAAAADAFVAALAAFQTEGDTLGAYTLAQAEAALAAAIAGNLSELDLTALAGWVIGVNTAGDALEGVELVPPSNATETAAGIVEKATSEEGDTPVADKYPDTIVAKEMIKAHSGLQFIEKKTASASASLDFTGLDATKYDHYVLMLANLIPTTDAQDLWLRTSTDGGATYDSGASDYDHVSRKHNTAGTGSTTSAANDAKIVLGGVSVGNAAAGDGVSGDVKMYGLHLTKQTRITTEMAIENNLGIMSVSGGMGARLSSADVDAFQLLFASGTIASGEATLYGMINE